MHNKENRFDIPFMTAIDAVLDYIIATHPDKEPGALVTYSMHDKIYSNGLRLDIAMKVGYQYFYQYERLLNKLLTFKLPTVAAITGHAFAGGLMFALAHDYRVMRSDRGFLCMNEVDMPGPLSPGMTSIIATKVPNAVTLRNILLQAHRFSADDALKNQMVDLVAPSSRETVAVAKDLARKWSSKALAGDVYTYLKTQMYITTSTHLQSEKLGFIEGFGSPKSKL
ncbi:hypothetical protein BATDEDRAFT_31993 [Batrachochytrium dendrobatidis JAM81]|uniref:Enoyl-CoA hydratase/isomerase n=1 Tax=Batrachochytrium dendrobatidis (strain JAM81 / FGSC 10211) TaxID=684364 RepID=F4P6D2_BATDJ|nr:uncharacterized protein BATDEDRAFT_31993 [Batrachochytrium dendrobatidis JAM81]EGF79329.1 hypothetical protein BATDEDRAFT_31993 [Batrachochytrium dendrobatidis JAM81]|eukprot:XP_006679959.1 hypothetical protein BATDEDRAFT_31993 [Batrachochytrium dendrobatidis JAM81]